MFYYFNKKSKGTVIFVLIAALLVLLSSLVMVSVSKPTETYATGGVVAVLKYKSLGGGEYEVIGIDEQDPSNIANKNNLVIVIPATYSGRPVTRIAKEAFMPTHHTFTSLDLSGASNLTSIGQMAFLSGSALKGTLVLPNSITTIEMSAFNGCSGLTGALTLPNSITSIEAAAFKECSGLTGTLTLPNSITSIGGNTFQGCSGFTALALPNSITSIGNSAFNGCSKLTGALTLPNSIASIGSSAFEGCSNLTGALTLPTNSKFTTVAANTFKGCSNLTGALTLPNSITSIGEYAFSNCSNLTGALTLPDSITSIGVAAFMGCSGLTGALTLPNSITSITTKAFDGCSGLKTVCLSNNSSTTYSGDSLAGISCPIVAPSVEIYNKVRAINTNITYLVDITFDAGTGGTMVDAQTLIQTKLLNKQMSFEKDETGVWVSNADYTIPTPTNGLATFDGWKNGTDSVTGETKVTADPATFSAQWSIAEPVINSTTGYSGTYDGKEHNILISATHAPEGVTLTYQWYKGTVGSGVLIADQTAATLSVKDVADSGSYYCIVTASYLQITQSAQSVAIAVSILQKEIGLTWAGIDDLVYSGLAKTTTASATDIAVGDTCNIAVQLTADHNNIDVGTFTYTAISVDNANYKLPTAATSGEYVITPKEVAAVWTKAGSYIYTGASQLDTISAKFVGVDGDIALTVAVVGDAEFKNAGTYSFVATNTNPNYNVTGLTLADVVIEAVTIEKPTLADDSLVYNGLVQTAAIATNDLYTLSGNQQTNAGLYTLTITLKSTVNSKWADGTTDAFTIAWTIAKAGLTVAADNKTVTYNVAFDAFTASYTGFVNDETVAVLSGTLAYACDYQVGTNVGSYPIAPSGYTSDNYTIKYVAGTLTVQKATFDMGGITFADVTLVEDDSVHTLVITGTLPEGVTVSYAGTNDYVVDGVSAAGIYTVTAIFTVADPDNFNVPEPMAATLIINIAQITDETEDGETGVIVGGANGMKPGTTIEVEEKSADAYKESNIVINGEKQTVLQVAGIEMLLDGAITQPDGSITIRLLIKSSLRSYSDLVVVSMAADGTSTNMNAVRDGNYLVFDTTYLTDYAIVAPTSIVSPPVLSGGAIAGIVIASIFVVLALIILAMFIFRKDKKVGFKAYYAGLTNKSTAKIKGLFKKDKNEVK